MEDALKRAIQMNCRMWYTGSVPYQGRHCFLREKDM